MTPQEKQKNRVLEKEQQELRLQCLNLAANIIIANSAGNKDIIINEKGVAVLAKEFYDFVVTGVRLKTPEEVDAAKSPHGGSHE